MSRVIDCPNPGCDNGTVLGRYAGVAGSETPDEKCPLCDGAGWLWDDDLEPFDTREEQEDARG